jgi:undecaprenyl-diphosphatase
MKPPVSLPALAGAALLASAVVVVVALVVARGVRRQAAPGSSWLQAVVLGLILASAAAAAAFFAQVADEMREQEWAPFDAAVRAFLLQHRSPPLDVLFRTATFVGSAWVVAPLCILAAVLLWRRGHQRFTAAVVVAPILGSGLIPLLKAGFERARPAGALAAHVASYSFPSGHATTSSAVAFTFAWVLLRERLAPRPLVIALGLLLPLTIGLSRIYLDVHWATDVLAGWAVGCFVAAVCAAFYEGLGGPRRAAT